MTPEELNRTVEFIIQSQARLAAAQEQDRADRIKSEQDRIEFERWSKGLSADVVRLLDHQSRRMDRFDNFHKDWQKQNEQMLRLLNSILDRLPPTLLQ